MNRMIGTLILKLMHFFGIAENTVAMNPIRIGVIEEIAPTFPGGFDKLMRFVKTHQKEKNFPAEIKGKVFVQFVVETTGELTEIEIVRGLCDQCDAEAIRLVKLNTEFYPGSQGGKLVRSRMVFPLVFNQ